MIFFLHNDVVITVLSGLDKQKRIDTFHKDVAIKIVTSVHCHNTLVQY